MHFMTPKQKNMAIRVQKNPLVRQKDRTTTHGQQTFIRNRLLHPVKPTAVTPRIDRKKNMQHYQPHSVAWTPATRVRYSLIRSPHGAAGFPPMEDPDQPDLFHLRVPQDIALGGLERLQVSLGLRLHLPDHVQASLITSPRMPSGQITMLPQVLSRRWQNSEHTIKVLLQNTQGGAGYLRAGDPLALVSFFWGPKITLRPLEGPRQLTLLAPEPQEEYLEDMADNDEYDPGSGPYLVPDADVAPHGAEAKKRAGPTSAMEPPAKVLKALQGSQTSLERRDDGGWPVQRAPVGPRAVYPDLGDPKAASPTVMAPWQPSMAVAWAPTPLPPPTGCCGVWPSKRSRLTQEDQTMEQYELVPTGPTGPRSRARTTATNLYGKQ